MLYNTFSGILPLNMNKPRVPALSFALFLVTQIKPHEWNATVYVGY